MVSGIVKLCAKKTAKSNIIPRKRFWKTALGLTGVIKHFEACYAGPSNQGTDMATYGSTFPAEKIKPLKISINNKSSTLFYIN